MIRAAVDVVGCDGARHAYTVLDRAHLSRMTFNDRSLEQEVLQLFERQAELLMARMRNSAPAAIATLAHTLKGSRSVSVLAASRRLRPPPNRQRVALRTTATMRSTSSHMPSMRCGPRSRRCNACDDGGWLPGANDYIEARVICDEAIPAILPNAKDHL